MLQHISEAVFEDDEHLVHMFEKIHFALFFVLVLFLMWALWLLACVAKREQILDAHETQIIYYGRLAKAKGGSEGPSVEDYGHHLAPPEDLRLAAPSAGPFSEPRRLPRLPGGPQARRRTARAADRADHPRRLAGAGDTPDPFPTHSRPVPGPLPTHLSAPCLA